MRAVELGTDLSPLSGKGASEMDEGVKISVSWRAGPARAMSLIGALRQHVRGHGSCPRRQSAGTVLQGHLV